LAHADRRVGDARPQPDPEKIEKNNGKNETENGEHRDSDKIESVHRLLNFALWRRFYQAPNIVAASLCRGAISNTATERRGYTIPIAIRARRNTHCALWQERKSQWLGLAVTPAKNWCVCFSRIRRSILSRQRRGN